MAKELNYAAPFILETVFKHAKDDLETPTERKAELAVVWEDIANLQSYPYDDTDLWQTHTGPKFYLTLVEQGTHLCLGDFKKMFQLWKAFRIKYYSYEDGQDFED